MTLKDKLMKWNRENNTTFSERAMFARQVQSADDMGLEFIAHAIGLQ